MEYFIGLEKASEYLIEEVEKINKFVDGCSVKVIRYNISFGVLVESVDFLFKLEFNLGKFYLQVKAEGSTFKVVYSGETVTDVLKQVKDNMKTSENISKFLIKS